MVNNIFIDRQHKLSVCFPPNVLGAFDGKIPRGVEVKRRRRGIAIHQVPPAGCGHYQDTPLATVGATQFLDSSPKTGPASVHIEAVKGKTFLLNFQGRDGKVSH